MEGIEELRRRLDRLRPLTDEQVSLLWPMWRTEDALYVYSTNAVEGSTLTLGETTVVLQHGVTIGQKTLREHLEAVDGQRAYRLMLDLAQKRAPIDRDAVLALHAAVVGDHAYAGQLRDHPVYIAGSMHVPPNYVKLSGLMDEMFQRYRRDSDGEHPVVAASRLHFDLLTIHPFADGNGRTARLVENLHLIQHGYAPILIGLDEKPRYFDVLQRGQLAVPGVGDATEFVDYMRELEERALERYVRALETAHGRTFG
jgi:Fic family protein